ncbi:MAG: CotH kinase family protein, partial [Opitutales bacterium]
MPSFRPRPFMSLLYVVRRFAPLLVLGTALALGAQPDGPRPPSHELPPPGEPGQPPAEDTPAEPELPLTAQFDRHGEHRLDAAERQAARDYLAHQPKPEPALTGHVGTLRPPPAILEPVQAGAKLTPAGVTAAPDAPFYDLRTLRTVFLDFTDADWEQELADFARTDVLVPARLTIDGRTYADVGVRFRPPAGPAGYKHSLQLVLDYAHPDQSLGGRHVMELHAPQADATFVRTVLYHQIARDYLYAPETNYVRVVLNGENWGIYLNQQPFDGLFVQTHYGTATGSRWIAAPGATLADLGTDPDAYRRFYRLQTPEDPVAWAALARLCRTLNQIPPDQLEAALAPLLDLDGTLRLLALDNALVNQDGYWNRGGGYGLYLDPAQRFHLIPLEAGAVLQYQQVAEFTADPGSGGRGGQEAERGGSGGKAGQAGQAERDLTPVIQAYQRSRDFPRQTTTDLAMLLSYSFITKADQNDDRKLTQDELLGFIRSWFTVMDEDSAGFLTREQFIAKFRRFIAPPSVRDGRSQQTFGKIDAPGAIGRDLFDAMDKDHDGQLTREEFVGAFTAWFASWSDPKTRLLTEDGLYRGLNNVLTQTIFQADQSYIDRKDFAVQADPGRGAQGGGREGRGGRGG